MHLWCVLGREGFRGLCEQLFAELPMQGVGEIPAAPQGKAGILVRKQCLSSLCLVFPLPMHGVGECRRQRRYLSHEGSGSTGIGSVLAMEAQAKYVP